MILKYLAPINKNQPFRLTSLFEFKFSEKFKVPYNINQAEHTQYLKKVQKLEKIVQESKITEQIPRRKRRLYDRPRIDQDLTNYGAWRICTQTQFPYKPKQHSLTVDCKISVQPKWFVHAFGIGNIPVSNGYSASRQYLFMDNQMSKYLVYEYRQTTSYLPNLKQQQFDYDNQEHIHPRMRLTKRPSFEQFWASQNYYDFRVNATPYSSKFKFRKWILTQIENRRNQQSYDDYITKRFGPPFTFNKKQQAKFFVKKQPMLRYVTPKIYEGEEVIPQVTQQTKKKKEKDKKVQKIFPQYKQKVTSYKFAQKLDQEYRVNKQEGMKAFQYLIALSDQKKKQEL